MNMLINKSFGNFDIFKNKFKEKALSIKGSVYTFLCLEDGNLKIVNLLSQDNPYNHNLIPLLAIDMCEHAYYINYENKKDIYIDNFLEILDFKMVNEVIMK